MEEKNKIFPAHFVERSKQSQKGNYHVAKENISMLTV